MNRLGDRDGKLIIFTYLKHLCINILTITIKVTQCPRGEMVDTKDLKSLPARE